MLLILSSPIRGLHRVKTSCDVLFLAPLSLLTSFPIHPTLFMFPSLLLLCLLLVLLPTSCFAFLLLLSSFLHFLFFSPLSFNLLISCVQTTSPHLPSSDPSGPETPSFSVLRPLPPPKVLTPQHTAFCAAVHTLSLRKGLIAKACLYPWWCLS